MGEAPYGVARVVVEHSLDREFDYSVPPEMTGKACVGCRVEVSFGRRVCHGFIVGLSDRSDHPTLKPLRAVTGDGPLFREEILTLARWVADYYLTPLEAVLRTMLPAPVRHVKGEKQVLTVRLADHTTICASDALDGSKTSDECRREEPRASERRARTTALQQKILAFLGARGPSPLTEVVSALEISEAPVRSLEKRGLLVVEQATVRRDPNAKKRVLPTADLPLMPQQAAALDQIRNLLDRRFPVKNPHGPAALHVPHGSGDPFTVLLYGVTGSGKTEVYLQAITAVRARGMGSIVLVPEIALTPQTVERFVSRFGERVAVLHSHLTDGERHDEWHRIRSGECDIVIGARSAVFAPVPRLGLVVVDEEHEPGYKQDEAPRYSARDVAVMRGKIEGCVVVLGSATPSMESWHNARRGKYLLARMPQRVDHRLMPVMRIVDMRQQTAASGKGGFLSQELVDAVRVRIEKGEQCILFHNRRGYATSLQCPKCGFVAQCAHCSVACTYHRIGEILRCHVCGTDKPVPTCCPGCKDPAYRFAGCGTQRIEEVVRKCFPKATVERLDSDVTRRRTAHEEVLDAFRAGRVDILIGTQMIAKGLHIPNVTLVGVVHADQGLTMPDFRAGERTFQLLAQVGGRAGRGDVSGEVIVQTYSPMHPAIQAARRLDLEGFCDQELAFREDLSYPPFSHLASVLVRGAKEETVSVAAGDLCAKIRGGAGGMIVSDAAPAPLARAKGQFRYQVLIRGGSASRIGRAVRSALAGVKLARGVVVSFDMDAVYLM